MGQWDPEKPGIGSPGRRIDRPSLGEMAKLIAMAPAHHAPAFPPIAELRSPDAGDKKRPEFSIYCGWLRRANPPLRLEAPRLIAPGQPPLHRGAQALARLASSRTRATGAA